MPLTYVKPVAPEDTITLTSMDLKATELTPKTAVLCINRGHEVYRDKCDGRDYEVPSGTSRSHLRSPRISRAQRGAGSRNPDHRSATELHRDSRIDKPELSAVF